MRVSKRWVFALVTCVCATAALAQDWIDYKHTSDDALVWRRSDHKALTLNSKDKNGVDVVSVSPDGLWGLHDGDRITSVNQTPIHQVSDLLEKLPRANKDTANLSIVHGGATRTVSITSDAYNALH